MPTGIYEREKGEESNNWKGGRRLSDGYWMICIPEHPRAVSCNYMYEHILIAEQMLGRPLLKGEEIHHMGRKDDNTRIKVCRNRAHHMLLHMRLRAVRAGVLPSWRKCEFCKKYDNPKNLHIDNGHVYHRVCRNEYQNRRRKKP